MATFGDLRSALARPPSIELFDEILRALGELEGEVLSRALVYALDHMNTWPEETRASHRLFPTHPLFDLLAPSHQRLAMYQITEQIFDEQQGETLVLYRLDGQTRYEHEVWWRGHYDGTSDTEVGSFVWNGDDLILLPERRRSIESRDIGDENVDRTQPLSGELALSMTRASGVWVPVDGSVFFRNGLDWTQIEFEPNISMWREPYWGNEHESGEFDVYPIGTRNYEHRLAKMTRRLPRSSGW